VRISVFGLGYVGCVSAACLARAGHVVTGVDVNAAKVLEVSSGQSPIVEPGVAELIAAGVASGRLDAVVDSMQAVDASDLSLVCVGTPSKPNGSLDLTHIENVCREIGFALGRKAAWHVVAIRSTVLPGTLEKRLIPILEQESGLRCGVDFGISMYPEFLREGSAVADYDNPSHVVIGQFDTRSGDAVAELQASTGAPVIRTDIRTAEMVKYASNAFHAVKVAFANEIGALCKEQEIDGRDVMEIFCQDRLLNISPAYLRPGFAFGGSCLPKDLRALVYRAKESDVECALLAAALESNRRHVQRGIDLVERLGFRRAGVLGLSFKADTDDVRESPTVALVEALVGRGYEVSIYDEHVDPSRLVGANKASLERELPHIAALMRSSVEQVLAEAEVVVIANGSRAFRDVPSRLQNGQVVIDLVGATRVADAEGYEGICW
jgi:GDP-mannose 6-dehydrogenase